MARTKTTSNPRAIMDSLSKLSQRPHKTKSGGETKKPGPRLKARRAKNTKAGYFPNPKTAPSAENTLMAMAYDAAEVTRVSFRKKTGDVITRQAHVSYTQGLLAACRVLGLIPASETREIMSSLRGDK